MTHKEELIKIVTSDKSFKKTCDKVSRQYSDDIFQEVCEQILISKEEKLPPISDLKFWFWRVASNIIRKKGKLGKYLYRESENNSIGEDLRLIIGYQDDGILSEDNTLRGSSIIKKTDHVDEEETLINYIDDMTRLSDIMISLSEFENRVVHLYVQLGNMKKVERATGLSYSALRGVKEKIKTRR